MCAATVLASLEKPSTAAAGATRVAEAKRGISASAFGLYRNRLQVELIRRYRGAETDARVREGLQLSINAVATALRNSG